MQIISLEKEQGCPVGALENSSDYDWTLDQKQ